MCVILIADQKRLSPTLIRQAVNANPDGNGLAWIENRKVCFRKAVTLDDVEDLASELPLPYVFHARIATVGGVKPGLCHPFPLDGRLNPTQLVGRTPKGVLFHNGHWSAWKQYVNNPTGEYSDSRVMAELVSAFGPDVIQDHVTDSQRVVLVTPKGVTRYGAGWTEVSKGIHASNTCYLRKLDLRFKTPTTTRWDDIDIAEYDDDIDAADIAAVQRAFRLR